MSAPYEYRGERPLLFWPAFLDYLADKALLLPHSRFKSTYQPSVKRNDVPRKNK